MALNHISIMGRICNDIELRRTGSGVPVASFTVAVDRDFKSGGEKETDFIDCVAWRNTAEFVERNFSKGKMIIVAGRLQIRKWTDKDGNKRNSAEIVAENVYFGDSKTSNGEKYEAAMNNKPLQDFAVLDGDDGDLPF
jgi:single-strand DNA-binding protein